MGYKRVMAFVFVAAMANQALAVAGPYGGAAYSGQIALNDPGLHRSYHDYKRLDEVGGGDSLFGSVSMQEQPTLAFNTLEIRILDAGELQDNEFVNGKQCPEDSDFKVFVSPIASCSEVYGRNFSGFRADAVKEGLGWKPRLWMNVGGAWHEIEKDTDGVPEECAKVLVQKICQPKEELP